MADAAQMLGAIRDYPWPLGEPGPQAIADLRRFVALRQPIASKLGMLPYSAAELAGWLAANLDQFGDADLDAIAEAAERWCPPGAKPASEPEMPPRPQNPPAQRRPRQQQRRTARTA